MMSLHGFDTECYNLAEYFLGDEASKAAKAALAQLVQETVESFLEMNVGSGG